jgi:hypothetical protein
MSLPRSIKHKIYYSKLQFNLLDSHVERYLKNPSRALRFEHDRPDDPRVILSAEEVPSIIRLLAGDVLQNFRSTLDYLVWELVLANERVPDEYNAFPVCSTPEGFKEAKKKRLRDVHPDAIALADQFQPFHFGQGHEHESVLYVLDKMTNINKHRSILMARPRVAILDEISVRDDRGGIVGYDAALAMDDEASARLLSARESKKNRVALSAVTASTCRKVTRESFNCSLCKSLIAVSKFLSMALRLVLKP